MATERRGTRVRAGEQVGHVMHPFTGDIVSEITAPREGVMLHAGASWPVLPEGVTLAILGDVVAEK
jgi:predicted deacylase